MVQHDGTAAAMDAVLALLKEVRRWRVRIPSLAEVYLVDKDDIAEHSNGGDSERESDGGPEPDDVVAASLTSTFSGAAELEMVRQKQTNWGPVIAGAAAVCLILPQMISQGIEGFWANAKDRIGIPSYRHFRTLWMSGELQYLDSLSGLFTVLFRDRMVALWVALCGASAYVAFSDPDEPEASDGGSRSGSGSGSGSVTVQSPGSPANVPGVDSSDSPSNRRVQQACATEPAPGLAVAYHLTIPQSEFQTLLQTAKSFNCRYVVQEVRQRADHTNSQVPVFQCSTLADGLPNGPSPVGVVVGKQPPEGNMLIEDYTPGPDPEVYAFVTSEEQCPCTRYMYSKERPLSAAAEALLNRLLDAIPSEDKANPLQHLQ